MIQQIFQRPKMLFQGLQLARFRRSIAAALALNRRGEARSDGLLLVSFNNLLKIRWRARRLHP